ncbi:hypothetical protein OS493_000670 [Desmophyllum pertusum]|uniref:Uncharacterized protein n=1 Tax=Desmophyllum pertusum TaxID=174260 RepID=A0A9X0A8B4_9CNID|nr:hypothetical protein OS493_000670 [Desmophyllum pertusum]
MAEEVPDLKRDSTMTVTAKEGEQFLEEHGKVHEDAKTRAQQKDLDENEEEEEDAASKLKRTSTMAATAQEGSDILGDEERGKTRSETAALKDVDEEGEQDESGEEDDQEDEEENGNCEENGSDKPAVKRDGTMVVTATEGEKFLEDAGHKVDGGTRGEAEAVKAAIEESEADKQNGDKEDEKTRPEAKRKPCKKP